MLSQTIIRVDYRTLETINQFFLFIYLFLIISISLSVSLFLYFLFQQLRFYLTDSVQFEFYVDKNPGRVFCTTSNRKLHTTCRLQLHLADREPETAATWNMGLQIEAKNAVWYRIL
jgi:hypothetical protein